MAFVTYETVSVSYTSYIIVFVVVISHTTKSWRGSDFFWLFVTKVRGGRDNDVRLRRLFVGELCKRGVRGSAKSCEMVFLISPCPF